MPLPAPRLLSRSPAPGEEQPLDAPITLTFDQPMDRASVEAAFAISPTVEGTFTWADDRTVAFSASGGLERDVRYAVTVAETAKNVEGKPMEEAAPFDFSTVGYLAVSQVMPGPNAEELDPNTTVTVIFNRPVVPLTAISRQSELPDPLTFTPPVRGQGEWLNTSIYLFRPEEGFLPATHYKARVAAGLTDTTGGILAEDYTWEFTTIRPAVMQLSPEDTFQYVGPTDVISVTLPAHGSCLRPGQLLPESREPGGEWHLPLERRQDAHCSGDDGLCASRALASRHQLLSKGEPGSTGSSGRDGYRGGRNLELYHRQEPGHRQLLAQRGGEGRGAWRQREHHLRQPHGAQELSGSSDHQPPGYRRLYLLVRV